MRYLNKAVKIIFKVLLLLIIVPVVFYSGFLFIQSVMRATSIYFCGEPIQCYANDFLYKYGNKYFAFDLIYYMSRQRDPDFCDELDPYPIFAKLLKKYPDMREEYLGALVVAILDSKTTNYNRIMLIYDLEQITGIKFTTGKDDTVEYNDMKPYTQKGIRNIADWWSKHLQANATAAIAATEKDYLFPPPSHEYLKLMGIEK